jgi:hypothetical protein
MDQAALIDKFRLVELANELENNPRAATRFSDPDGVHSGKSGWSFGECQFDLQNNPVAATCLRACGFTAEEIAGLKAQTIDAKALEPKLKASAAIIQKFDRIQFSFCVTRTQAILSRRNITPADDTALLAVADYANQYYLSDIDKPGYLVHHLLGLGRAFTALDVLNFKLDHTPYGKKHPGDCRRRYDNLVRVMGQA